MEYVSKVEMNEIKSPFEKPAHHKTKQNSWQFALWLTGTQGPT
ncbi:hypothetical protein [Pseudomonas duriflava]|nr:hypothetical protein [Pseudomonas duriflava]